jgi:hypothetical protein
MLKLNQAIRDSITPKIQAHWARFPGTARSARLAQALVITELKATLLHNTWEHAPVGSMMFDLDEWVELLNDMVLRSVQLVTAGFCAPDTLETLYQEHKDAMLEVLPWDFGYLEDAEYPARKKGGKEE